MIHFVLFALAYLVLGALLSGLYVKYLDDEPANLTESQLLIGTVFWPVLIPFIVYELFLARGLRAYVRWIRQGRRTKRSKDIVT